MNNYPINILWRHNSLAPNGEVFILDHSDGMLTPGLCHGPYICIGVTSGVILQDSVEKFNSVITSCNHMSSLSPQYKMLSNTKYKYSVIQGHCSQVVHGTGQCSCPNSPASKVCVIKFSGVKTDRSSPSAANKENLQKCTIPVIHYHHIIFSPFSGLTRSWSRRERTSHGLKVEDPLAIPRQCRRRLYPWWWSCHPSLSLSLRQGWRRPICNKKIPVQEKIQKGIGEFGLWAVSAHQLPSNPTPNF